MRKYRVPKLLQRVVSNKYQLQISYSCKRFANLTMDPHADLPEGWSAVGPDDEGDYYWWNEATNEVINECESQQY